MKKLNVLEVSAIITAAEMLVEGEVYETIEEAVEYTAEAWQVFMEEGGDPRGDEVLEAVLEGLDYLQHGRKDEAGAYKPAGIAHHPAFDVAKLVYMYEDQPIERGQFLCTAIGGYWVREDLSGDLSSYLAPWGAELLTMEKARPSWEIESKEWKFTKWSTQGPEEFLEEYQELGWYVYRHYCWITGYWRMVASPKPLKVVEERIVYA